MAAAGWAGYTAGKQAERPREPLAVHALRLSYPDLLRGRSTTEVGDLAADLCRRLSADEPVTELAASVERALGATPRQALNVVLDVWTHACPTAPTPNRDGELKPQG